MRAFLAVCSIIALTATSRIDALANSYILYDGEIVTRKSAIEISAKRYFTGKPCKHGHLSERAVSNKTCCYCLQLKNERYAKDGYFTRLFSKNMANDPQGMREKFKRHHQSCNSKIKKRAYRAKNIEKYRKMDREWSKNNVEKVRAKRNNRKNAVGHISAAQIRKMMNMQKGKCIDCKRDIRNSYHVDHIMPLKLGGNNMPNNIQLLCPTCNMRKGAKDPFVWARENGRLL